MGLGFGERCARVGVGVIELGGGEEGKGRVSSRKSGGGESERVAHDSKRKGSVVACDFELFLRI